MDKGLGKGHSREGSPQYAETFEKEPIRTAPEAFAEPFSFPLDDSPQTDRNPTTLPLKTKEVIAIGGGKGGVGKSLIASSLAIALSRLGNRVVAIDLDLGGANLHTTLGLDLPKQTLNDFFHQRITSIEKCISPSGIPHLGLISGAHDPTGITNIRPQEKADFIKNIRTIEADYIILDLGAGTSLNTLDFFLQGDTGIITLLPEPTSIENGYRFIKSAYYHHLAKSPYLQDIRSLIDAATDPKNSFDIKSPADLYREVNKVSAEAGMRLKVEIEKFKISLVINQVRTQMDIEIGNSIKTVCKKYFGIQVDYIGHLDYDNAVWQSIRRKRPFMLEFPNSKLVSSIEHIAQSIVRENIRRTLERKKFGD